MNDNDIQPIKDPKEMPSGLSDGEQLAYWETHGLTEDYLQKTEEVPEDERPQPRTRAISVRFDGHTIARLKNLADRRGIGYQTLLKEFVTERLYEEEKRAGVLPFDSPKSGDPAAFATAAAALSTTYGSLRERIAAVPPEDLTRDLGSMMEEAFSEGWSKAAGLLESGLHSGTSRQNILEALGWIEGNPQKPRHRDPAKHRDTN
jgi:predicted DNA binding CopG/RHH family protein